MQLVGGLFRNKRAIAPAAQESARIGSSRTGSFRIGSFRIGSFREGSKTDRCSGSAKMLQVATSGHESEEEYYDTCTSKFIPNAAADDQAPSDQERSSCTNRGAAAAADPIDNHVLLRKPSSNSKPHKANDMGWEAIQELRDRDGAVGLSHFKLVKRLGCGDIGSVYLCELRGTDCYFAMKVMDKGALAMRKKLARAQTEKEILASLDHPFLPTLYAHFETSQFSCLVMEYCSGGDLHSLRQKQTGKCFTDMAAKFYAAEVLLALEYLHMMGVVYRDLKPENVLVRADGHIMLSDFDLSLRCVVSPTLVMSPVLTSIPSRNSRHKLMEFTVEPNTVSLQSCVPIMSHRFLRTSLRKKSSSSSCPVQEKVVVSPQTTTRPELVVEPTEVRSMSFVGTHEYLAPEIISGDGHGSSVDWWTFGIFLYELLYAKTPFKGADNELTLTNVVSHPLLFPSNADAGLVPEAAKDLIRGLLVKDPMKRLGSLRGAGEIKSQSFFEGVNWALIRCALPPEIPKPQYRPVRSGKSVGTAAGEKKKAANGWKQEEEEDVSHVVPEFQCF